MGAVAGRIDLYAQDLDDFITARDDLARRLRGEGKEDEADDVARLRKPTTDAWALNQVARRHPELIEELTATHEALRKGDGASLRQASETRRRLIDRITEAAAAVLTEAGRSTAGSTLDRVSRTLLAGAGDDETEAALREGTLTRAVEISAEWPTFFAPAGEPSPRPEDDLASTAELERLEARFEELDEVAQGLRQKAKEARDVLEEARRRWEEADQDARAAERAAKSARDEAQAARRKRR